MNYGNIKKYDIADGPGVRVSLFVSGCRHHCKGCFNPETWDFAHGEPYTEKTEKEILEALKPGYIAGFTVLGGEPFEPENQVVLKGLLAKIKNTYPEKDIWCYSGYTYETDLAEGGAVHTEDTDEMLSYIDVLVDCSSAAAGISVSYSCIPGRTFRYDDALSLKTIGYA